MGVSRCVKVILGLSLGLMAACGVIDDIDSDDASVSKHKTIADHPRSDPKPPAIPFPPSPSKPEEGEQHTVMMQSVVGSLNVAKHFKHGLGLAGNGEISLSDVAKDDLHPSVHDWVSKTIDHLNEQADKGNITIESDFHLTVKSVDFLPPEHAVGTTDPSPGTTPLTSNFLDLSKQKLFRPGELKLSCNDQGWVAWWWGWQAYFTHDTVELIAGASEVAAHMAGLLGGIPVIGHLLELAVTAYISIYHAWIEGADHGCGATLNQSWFQYLIALWFPPAALWMWVTSQ